MFLEDEGKYKEAENAFILAGKPREAILMYIHNEDWPSALNIAEAYDPSSVTEVLAGQAKVAFQNKENAKGEALILRAQRPDLAIKFYKETNQWKEALRFAKEYTPNKVIEVNQEYEKFLSGQGGSGKEEILSNAKIYEQQKDYSLAIEMYLRLSTNHSSDINFLEEKWEYAVKLAVKFLPDRITDVARLACTRLVDAKRFDSAGALYFAVEMYKESIDAFVAGSLWDKARDVLKKAPKYSEYLDALFARQAKRPESAARAVSSETSANLETYAQRADWAKCVEIAAAQVRIFSKLLFFRI